MDYDIRDIQYTLIRYYQQMINEYSSTVKNEKHQNNFTKTKPKFTESTLKRLYKVDKAPNIKEKEN